MEIPGRSGTQKSPAKRAADRPYRILAFWRKPPVRAKGSLDAWIPALSPSCVLRERLAGGIISWGEFAKSYGAELRAPSSQNLLKPLALLSLRREVRVLCPRRFFPSAAAACPCPRGKCMSAILSGSIASIRRSGRFHMLPEENGWKST